MSKLIKYEFIKNRLGILISLGCIFMVEIIFLFSYYTKEDISLVISLLLLFFGCYICNIFGLIVGTRTYTRELSDKTGYMVYMTPNSYYKIIGSKYIFTLLLELIYIAVTFLLIIFNMAVFIGDFEQLKDTLGDIIYLFRQIDTYDVIVGILILFIKWVINTTCIVSFYNICHTFSSTIIRNNAGRKWITALIFIFGGFLLIRIDSALPHIWTSQVENSLDILIACIPHYLYGLGIIVASMFGTAFMLEKRINL